MFLSNQLPIFSILAVITIVVTMTACGSTTNVPDGGRAELPKVNSSFPFDVSEPEVFQCDAKVSVGPTVKTYKIARDHDRRRTDVGASDPKGYIEMDTDQHYLIAPAKKIYSAEPFGDAAKGSTSPVSDAARMFKGVRLMDMKDAGASDGLHKYTAKMLETGDTVTITINEDVKMIVRQEIVSADGQSKFLFEITNLETTVKPETFDLPPGLKKVSRDDLTAALR